MEYLIFYQTKKKQTKNTFRDLRKQRKLIFQDKSVFKKIKTSVIFSILIIIYFILCFQKDNRYDNTIHKHRTSLPRTLNEYLDTYGTFSLLLPSVVTFIIKVTNTVID